MLLFMSTADLVLLRRLDLACVLLRETCLVGFKLLGCAGRLIGLVVGELAEGWVLYLAKRLLEFFNVLRLAVFHFTLFDL